MKETGGDIVSYIIAVFRSRNECTRFFNYLSRERIPAQIINTPKEANVSCGISVKYDKKFHNIAKNILTYEYYSTFLGFYRLNLYESRYIRLE